MKSAIQECLPWTRGRFLWMAGALFILQAGLIFLFGDRSRPQSALGAPSVCFRDLGASASEDELLGRFFAGDPAVFSLPSVRGFSGRGWLNQQPPAYQPENHLQPPNWLNLDTARLGTRFPAPASELWPMPLDLFEQPSQREEPPPAFLGPENVPAQSVLRLEGGLSDRLLGVAPPLRAWPSAKILTASMVQIGVNPAGEVVAARLEESCGSGDADADAVAETRALRFRPSPGKGTRWGEAVFQWQTAEAAGAEPQK
jgi:TonB family protein